jgi:DNA-binding NarL/FixJ family response regulator
MLLGTVADGKESVASKLSALTSREREVLQQIAEGSASKEIAEDLQISRRTVESHRANLMRKLGVHKASGLVRIAIREGLLAP